MEKACSRLFLHARGNSTRKTCKDTRLPYHTSSTRLLCVITHYAKVPHPSSPSRPHPLPGSNSISHGHDKTQDSRRVKRYSLL